MSLGKVLSRRVVGIGTTVSLAAGLLLVPALSPAPAKAAAESYTTPGSYSFTVPSGVTSISVLAIGGGGGGGFNGAGGGGARVSATISVTPGDTLDIAVGGGGGGGSEAGGGGSSSVNAGSVDQIIAGGGGGASGDELVVGSASGGDAGANPSGAGNDGVSSGGFGSGSAGLGGGGGTGGAGGTGGQGGDGGVGGTGNGGAGGDGTAGTDGSGGTGNGSGTGGSGGSSGGNGGGGGGGGGYGGGGGGSTFASGGGGGSTGPAGVSFATEPNGGTSGSESAGSDGGSGSVVLTYSVAATYAVTYDANTATGGSVPVDGSSPYVEGATVTVLGNTGSMTKTGYTFTGWNTAANGSGTGYLAADTFTMGTSPVTLYAQWAQNTTPPGPNPGPEPNPGGDRGLLVKAPSKAKKLTPGKRTRIVRSATTDGAITKVKTDCMLKGKKLKGKDKRAACKIKTRKTRATFSNVRVWVKPKCSVGLKVRVKIAAKAEGQTTTKWQRTWKVKNKPKTYCALNADG